MSESTDQTSQARLRKALGAERRRDGIALVRWNVEAVKLFALRPATGLVAMGLLVGLLVLGVYVAKAPRVTVVAVILLFPFVVAFIGLDAHTGADAARRSVANSARSVVRRARGLLVLGCLLLGCCLLPSIGLSFYLVMAAGFDSFHAPTTFMLLFLFLFWSLAAGLVACSTVKVVVDDVSSSAACIDAWHGLVPTIASLLFHTLLPALVAGLCVWGVARDMVDVSLPQLVAAAAVGIAIVSPSLLYAPYSMYLDIKVRASDASGPRVDTKIVLAATLSLVGLMLASDLYIAQSEALQIEDSMLRGCAYGIAICWHLHYVCGLREKTRGAGTWGMLAALTLPWALLPAIQSVTAQVSRWYGDGYALCMSATHSVFSDSFGQRRSDLCQGIGQYLGSLTSEITIAILVLVLPAVALAAFWQCGSEPYKVLRRVLMWSTGTFVLAAVFVAQVRPPYPNTIAFVLALETLEIDAVDLMPTRVSHGTFGGAMAASVLMAFAISVRRQRTRA